jgi:hypothetical protein
MHHYFSHRTLFFAAIFSAFATLIALTSQGHAQVILDEQFNGSSVDTSVFTFDNGSTIFGRVRLNSAAPPVQNGTLRLRLQSYNPIDTGSLFFADEVRTIQEFAPTENFGFSFATRARFVDDATNPLSPGIIGGIFLFGLDANFPNPNERDEIDFELLSNNPQNSISTNIFNDDGFNVGGDFVITSVPGLDLTQFNDYRIEIQIDSTRFFVNDQLIREETTDLAIDPQDFRLNISAQGPAFAAAYSAEIQPTSNPAQNEIFIMEVDSLVITQIPPNGATAGTFVLADFTTSTTAQAFERFDGFGTLTGNGFEITLGATTESNFGLVAEFNDNLITEGIVVDADTQLLVEAIIGGLNDTDLVVAVREESGEFFSVNVPAADLADDGRAIVNLSDFFFNGDTTDGVPNGVVTEVSFQSPFGSGNAVDFSLQRISIVNSSPVTLGDVDMNGEINFADIPAFIAILQAGDFKAEADIDQSGAVNFQDIPEFITILISQ